MERRRGKRLRYRDAQAGEEDELNVTGFAFRFGTCKIRTAAHRVGMGKNEFGELEEDLQVSVNLPYIPKSQCNKSWNGLIKDHQICAGLSSLDTCDGDSLPKETPDFRLGDSGGPLVLPDASNYDFSKESPALDLIVGITSFGPRDCDGSKPGVCTNLGYFKDWIESVVIKYEPPKVSISFKQLNAYFGSFHFSEKDLLF